MIDLVAAVNDERTLEDNLLRSPVLRRPGVALWRQQGHGSAALAFRAAMQRCRNDIVVFAHQDVYLPGNWPDRLMRHIDQLDERAPNWAVLGVYGVKATGRQIGCVWSSGLNAMFGGPFEQPEPVESIDEVLIVLRRSSGVEFDPNLPGYHLYGTDLVQTALARGLGAYAVFAPLVHNSRPSLYLGRDYFKSYDYVARKWRHRLPIHNNVARIVRPSLSYMGLRARHRINEWRYAHVDRAGLDRHYDCVAIAHQLGLE